MSLAVEAKLGALFSNAKEAVYIQQILTEMGHPQPKTHIRTNNRMAELVINNRVQPKRLKAIDMVPLAEGSRSTRPIQNLLAPGQNKSSGLLDKASFPRSSHEHESRFFD
jgi:hypothetical protein